MQNVTDSAGTSFDPFVHVLTDGDPPTPYLTSTGKFRKLKEGTSNSDSLIERWMDGSGQASEAAKFNKDALPLPPAQVPPLTSDTEVPAEELNLRKIADAIGASFEPRKNGGVFRKNTRAISVSRDNITDEKHLRRVLQSFGVV